MMMTIYIVTAYQTAAIKSRFLACKYEIFFSPKFSTKKNHQYFQQKKTLVYCIVILQYIYIYIYIELEFVIFLFYRDKVTVDGGKDSEKPETDDSMDEKENVPNIEPDMDEPNLPEEGGAVPSQPNYA
jgi:hypothetical protein